MGKNLIVPGGSRVIDARGKFVMPGWFSDIKLIKLCDFGKRTLLEKSPAQL